MSCDLEATCLILLLSTVCINVPGKLLSIFNFEGDILVEA